LRRDEKTGKRASDRGLADYRRKRDFSRTREPEPRRAGDNGRQFVVQKHAARRLHYDLRLELDGVLKSWAVTKGPTLTVGEKRLAVRTEDHPIEYLDFEGVIPKGEYGGGTMIVWDRGNWIADGDPHRGLAKGHLAFSLEGTRLRGRWHLVRIRPRVGEKTEPWLLIKSDDAFARPAGHREITDEETTSYLSGRTNEELAVGGDIRTDHVERGKVARARNLSASDIAKIRGARKGLLPVFLEPSRARLCEKPPRGAKWVHEIKHDGYRIEARIDGRKIRLLTRNNLDWTNRFSGIATALAALGLGSALLDGEIVVEDANGISSFNTLQADLAAGRQDRFRYYAFDLLYCEGLDLTKAVLIDRKNLLARLIATLPPGSPISLSEHLDADGATMFEHAARLGLEGIVSKRKDLPYRPGRGEHWLKSKCVERQEFVIAGYVPSTAAKGSVGSLLLGYREGARFLYAGRVGTGWSAEQARSLRNELDRVAANRSPFATPLPAGAEKNVRWAEPRLVCDIQYRGWTADGLLRAASFKGLREDERAEDIVVEQAPKRSKSDARREIAGVRLTHPERILWEGQGVTKQGLAEFYTDIADFILPHIAGRVLSLLRCPSGASAKCFYAKYPWQGLSDDIRRVDVGEKQPMLAIEGLAGLISLVQAGVVEIHPWGSKSDDLDHPDRLILDLDPGEGVPWHAVVEAATEVRERLDDFGLKSFVKTSGGKGLHVVVPIEPRGSWDDAKTFTSMIAETMTRERPDRYVATLAMRARRGRIFIDYLRNGRGATAVAAYSTRALPKAPVSTPLAWEELSDGVHADHFNVDNLLQRLDFLKRDPWHAISKVRQCLPETF
jgi:bifunctional non-homologous end joining protein LigD